MNSKIYIGTRILNSNDRHLNYASNRNHYVGRGLCQVTVDDEPLESYEIDFSRNDILFEWGYKYGVFPTNLALSILTDFFMDNGLKPDIPSLLVYLFRDNVIANFPYDGWSLSEDQLLIWLNNNIDLLDQKDQINYDGEFEHELEERTETLSA